MHSTPSNYSCPTRSWIVFQATPPTVAMLEAIERGEEGGLKHYPQQAHLVLAVQLQVSHLRVQQLQTQPQLLRVCLGDAADSL